MGYNTVMKIEETIRKDGLRIISAGIPTQKKVYVSVTCMTGFIYDPEEKSGLSHFFEHMAFKGTKRRSAEDIRAFTGKNFLGSNASTSRMFVDYYGTGVAHKLPLMVDLLCDIYLNPTYPAKELQKEKNAVLLERARNYDDDDYVAHRVIRENLWRMNPMRREGVGTEGGMKKITRADLLALKKGRHVPSNTLIFAAGKLTHGEFVKEVNKRFPLGKGSVAREKWDEELNLPPMSRRVEIKKPKRNKATIFMAGKVPWDISDKESIASGMLSRLLISGTNSRLFREIREKRGLAYAVGGSSSSADGLGAYLYVYAEVDPKNVNKVEGLMRKSLQTPLKSKKDFEDAKERALDSASLEDDGSLGVWENIVWECLMKGKPVKSVAKYYKLARTLLEKTTLREAEELRKKYLNLENFVTVIVRPE